jgi:hypothetical protein
MAMLRDLLEIMAGTVWPVLCSIGITHCSLCPLERDSPLIEHLPAVGTKIHGPALTLERSLVMEQAPAAAGEPHTAATASLVPIYLVPR